MVIPKTVICHLLYCYTQQDHFYGICCVVFFFFFPEKLYLQALELEPKKRFMCYSVLRGNHMLLNYCDLFHVNKKPQLTYSRIKCLKGALTIQDIYFLNILLFISPLVEIFISMRQFHFILVNPLIFLFSTQKRQIKKKKHRISSSRWKSRRMCAHLFLREHQICYYLLNNH